MFQCGIAVLIAYVFGAIPTGYWFSKIFFDIDVTKHGSGNIGATNVARVLNNNIFFPLIFIFDACKAYAALFFIEYVCATHLLFVCAGVLLVGNAYSIFIGFKGGKGVSTWLGILFFFFPLLGVAFIGVWLVLLLITKSAALSSLAATTCVTLLYFVFYGFLGGLILILFADVWIFIRHIPNIKILLKSNRI